MELFSAVQERLQERISPLRAWLFPRRVFLQLEDQSITAMALEGRRIIWLERVPLPAGLCENGEAIRTDSIADLLGDLFVERGFSGARVDAVLPPAASQMRLVQWPDAAWPNDPERTLSENEQQLALKTALQYLDLHLVDLDRDPPTSLLVTVPSSTLDRWIEVFDLAGVPLDRMESASLCLCRGLQPLLQEQPVGALSVVLQLEPQRSELLVLENDLPAYSRHLSGVENQAALRSELQDCLDFWRQLRPELVEPPLLLLHGSALRDDAQARELAEAVGCHWQLIDPLAQEWLVDVSPDEGLHPEGPALAPLWGLAAVGLLP